MNKSDESEHLYLVSDFRRNAFSFSLSRMMLTVGLSCMTFIMLRYIPSMPTFWRIFIINGYWISSKKIVCTYWGNHMFCFVVFCNLFVQVTGSFYILYFVWKTGFEACNFCFALVYLFETSICTKFSFQVIFPKIIRKVLNVGFPYWPCFVLF